MATDDNTTSDAPTADPAAEEAQATSPVNPGTSTAGSLPTPTPSSSEPIAQSAPAADRAGSDAAPEPGSTAPAESSGEPSNAATDSPLTVDAEADGGAAGTPSAETPPSAEAGSDEQALGEDGKKKRKRRRKKKPTTPSNRPSMRASDRAPFHIGEEVFGKVTAVLDTAIMVDLSGKALAIFDRGEMEADDLVPAETERFVARIHNDGGRGGLVVLTRKPLREEEAKPRVEKAMKEGELIQGLVTGVIKGGVEVDIDGLRAFAPASGMDLHPAQANLTPLVGQRIDFKVVQFEKAGRDVVVTRRPMLESEAHERRKRALTLLQEGQTLKGVVRTVVEWGAFVALPDAENLEGLVHISEASHDARARITDLVKPGESLEVKILKIDEKGKIWLSRKALLEDPWAAAKQKYAPGTKHEGTVKNLEDFGAFIELEPGVEGLMFTDDISFERIEHPREKLSEGDKLEVVVSHFEARSRKVALHPAPPAARADEARQKLTRNALIKAEVVKIETSGVVMRVLGATGRVARAYLPAAQTGTGRGSDLRKLFKLGSVIDAKVVDLHPRSGEAKLSIRALKDDEERRAHREYRQKLKSEAGFGTLGDLLRQKLNLGDDSKG